ncbi:sigma factor-like helix-turn-helix DNA-binding protein [Mycoplasmopsis primatum]|uniref:sigma factor-like helix-turn-helix DNA-binding protein n=1 Tax=Mycoplasmopsis primatum TaxID=55604 RepID=UPI000496971D|nr:sigma factor-like helix-turn-helix DNA-binding protein [Mycoplasmopsis primatum]
MNKNDINDIENVEHLCQLFEKFNGLLTQTQKQAFKLYFYENLSYSEIAKISATTRSAAYDSVHKAIARLKNIEENTSLSN